MANMTHKMKLSEKALPRTQSNTGIKLSSTSLISISPNKEVSSVQDHDNRFAEILEKQESLEAQMKRLEQRVTSNQ